jgi:hypothetical protein
MAIDTLTEARDELLRHITTAWNAQASPPPLLYDDNSKDLPDNGPFARITVQFNQFDQRTLGGKPALGGGGRRFGRTGTVTVQIFTLFDDGLTNSDLLVDLVIDAFEGEATTIECIWFRNVSVTTIGQTGVWHQTNVLAEFDFDRIK